MSLGNGTLETCEGVGDLKRPVGRMARIISYLHDHKGQDIPISDVVEATGIEAKHIKTAVERNSWDVVMLGFRYVAGARGRGKTHIIGMSVGRTRKHASTPKYPN